MAHQNHQTPLDRPTHFANAGDHQNFNYAAAHGNLMLPMFPPVLPQPPLMPQFVHPHPQYAQPLPMMHNPYGQFQAYGVPVNPVHEARQQAAHVHPVPAPIPAPIPQPAYAPKNCPNREIRPGVFAFEVNILDGEKSETFYADTEMPWAEFRDRVVRILGDPQNVQLSAKIVGEGKMGVLNGAEGMSQMMQRIVQKASNARTKPVALEVKNSAPPLSSNKPKSKGKRSRKEDIPPAVESDDENNGQYKAYKQLSEETRCEAHHGHCYVTRKGGSDNHYRLSHQEMTLWAKKMSLNQATIYAPPHCLNFDCGPTLKSGRRTASNSSVPEVHVTIQNIAPDSGPSSSVTSSAGPSATSSSASPSISGTPFQSGANSSALSWGVPIPALQGQNIFPPLSSVMALLDSERPGQYWNQLEGFLREAGVSSSEHILLADPTVLALVGNMGTQKAIVLRNYAKRIVLPVLGLRGTYQEDEKEDEDPTSISLTRKRPLDLGESIVQSFYKKPKIEPMTPPKPLSEKDLDTYLLIGDQDLPKYEFLTDFVEITDEGDEDSEEEKFDSGEDDSEVQ